MLVRHTCWYQIFIIDKRMLGCFLYEKRQESEKKKKIYTGTENLIFNNV